MVAVVILAVGLGAGVHAILEALSLNQEARERSAALEAAQSVYEELRSTPFDEVFPRYNRAAGDNPVAGPSPGGGFAVPGLSAAPGDPDGLPGEIFFPGNGILLDENFVDSDLGMPRDLDGSGVLGTLATGYQVLPLRIRVRWSGAHGVQEIDLASILNHEAKP
jgi:hypothetical protein